jgi:hypothetical protein
MAKELPYFRFTVQEWQNGDISMESYELKGLFIDVCGFYWMKDCSVKKELLYKRFSNARAMLEQLLSNEIIKVDSDNNICIEFLNEQFDLLSENRKKRQLAGQKGGLSKSSNATAMLQQNSSYKDKDKDNNNNKSFIVDANKNPKTYQKYFFDLIANEYKISRDELFLKCKIDLSLRNEIWQSFISNSMQNVPQIEDNKHAWNTFKRFVTSNKDQYKIKSETYQGF